MFTLLLYCRSLLWVSQVTLGTTVHVPSLHLRYQKQLLELFAYSCGVVGNTIRLTNSLSIVIDLNLCILMCSIYRKHR